jgi:hypothetical protein
MSLPLRFRTFAVGLLTVGLCSAAFAAEPSNPIPPGLSDSLNNLADQPATHTGVVFDRGMIQDAANILQQGGLDADHAAAALNSISFDTYRYKQPAFYTPETMATILDAYHRAGWKHLVDGNKAPVNGGQTHSAITDVWLHFTGGDIDHVTVLVRGVRDMSLIQVAGDLRPLDLLHLSGHFGIPKFDSSAVMVPAPDGR